MGIFVAALSNFCEGIQLQYTLTHIPIESIFVKKSNITGTGAEGIEM
jgi:hypothetical protein